MGNALSSLRIRRCCPGVEAPEEVALDLSLNQSGEADLRANALLFIWIVRFRPSRLSTMMAGKTMSKIMISSIIQMILGKRFLDFL
jgi:hypothetical protein